MKINLFVLHDYSKIRNKTNSALFTFTELTEPMKRLSELEAGEQGIINSFEKDEIFIKLMEMGCIPGESVKVEQIAPLGDPISISVSGYTLSLRLSEANSIFIEPDNP
jgi:ferrous iron transport protein A